MSVETDNRKIVLEFLRAFSEGDFDRVAVEAKSDATFTSGRTYRNDYVFMFTLHDGKITEVKEYMDTELARETFLGT